MQNIIYGCVDVVLPTRLPAIRVKAPTEMVYEIGLGCCGKCGKTYTSVGTDTLCITCRRKSGKYYALAKGAVVGDTEVIPKQVDGLYVKGFSGDGGAFFPQAIPYKFDNSVDNMKAALLSRHIAQVPLGNPIKIKDCVNKCVPFLLKYIQSLCNNYILRCGKPDSVLGEDIYNISLGQGITPTTMEYRFEWANSFEPSKRKGKLEFLNELVKDWAYNYNDKIKDRGGFFENAKRNTWEYTSFDTNV